MPVATGFAVFSPALQPSVGDALPRPNTSPTLVSSFEFASRYAVQPLHGLPLSECAVGSYRHRIGRCSHGSPGYQRRESSINATSWFSFAVPSVVSAALSKSKYTVRCSRVTTGIGLELGLELAAPRVPVLVQQQVRMGHFHPAIWCARNCHANRSPTSHAHRYAESSAVCANAWRKVILRVM